MSNMTNNAESNTLCDIARSGCHVMAKPSGSMCNIDCDYCFYLEKYQLYPERYSHKDHKKRDDKASYAWQMNEQTLELYIRQQIEAQDNKEVVISWQGGEPTLMGLDFFQRAVALSHQYAGDKNITHTLQTNGLLLNDEWCAFFRQYGFLIGISIDGPAEQHNYYRKTRSGKLTHSKVEQAIKLLQKHGVNYNALVTVNNYNAHFPIQIYDYLLSLGVHHIQFIPIIERVANQPTQEGLYLISPEYKTRATVTPWSVSAKDYGEFLCQIFSQWVHHDVGKVFIQLFDTTLGSTLGYPASICIFSETCGDAFALEANGDIYSCDHYVYPEHKLGNIHHTTIREINHSLQAHAFGKNKKTSLPIECKTCTYQALCHGGCPKHRFELSRNGKPELNYFCAAYIRFFSYSAPYMRKMAELIHQQRSPAQIMKMLDKTQL